MQKNFRMFKAKQNLVQKKQEKFISTKESSTDDLDLYEKTFLKIGPKHFYFSVYLTKQKDIIKFTIRAFKENTTIVELKQVNVAQFKHDMDDDGKIDVDDIVAYIKDNLKGRGSEIVVDEKDSRKAREGWDAELFMFIEDELTF